jgi:hypothetical protein
LYLYAEGTLGSVTDGNERRSVAAGAGFDLLELGGGVDGHMLRVKYDYYFLSLLNGSSVYFAPSSLQVHVPGLEWRWRPGAHTVLGVEAGLPLQSSGELGYLAGAFFSIELEGRFILETRARTVDDTAYRLTAVTVGLAAAF